MPAETLPAVGINKEAFDEFLASRDEPDWLKKHRESAWAEFESLGMPSMSDEEWMRTDIRLFKLNRYALPLPGEAAAAEPHALLADGVDLGGRTASVNSHSVREELADDLAAKGVLFG
ncbi:MAG: Fe-S cluster assembly protein SufD, partial [Planctomycetota bacterium]